LDVNFFVPDARLINTDYTRRAIESGLDQALKESRVVLLEGPRQAGKSTLVRRLSHDSFPYITLDDSNALAAARADPIGFVRGLDRAVMDEIQRAPELERRLAHFR
jgi:uncharacterized protein